VSALDAWGSKDTPCDHCGGLVKWFSFEGDCHGNESSGGIYCTQCKHNYTEEEWDNRP
jgi:hypothetical protein